MGVDKTEIKKAAYVEVGLSVEKLRDAAELEVAEHKGGAKALKSLTTLIRAEAAHVETDYLQFLERLKAREAELAKKEDREPGPVSMGPMDIMKFGLGLISRAANQAENAGAAAKNQELIAQGSLGTLEAVVKSIGKSVAVAQAQIEKKLLTDEEGDAEHDPDSDAPRPAGVRPRSIKQQRQAEAAGEKQPEVEQPEEDSVDEDAPTNPGKEPPTAPVEEPSPPPAAVKQVTLPKAMSPTAVQAVAPVAPKKPRKKAAKKRKGRLEEKFKGNGVRK